MSTRTKRKAGDGTAQPKQEWSSRSLMDRLAELERRRIEAEAKKQKSKAPA